MPELPEVETIRRGLEKKIIGLTIKDLVMLNSKSVQFDPQKTRGLKVLKVWRRAKILGIDLGRGPVSSIPHSMSSLPTTSSRSLRALNGAPLAATPSSILPAFTLLFHLKMTGQLVYVGSSGDKVMGGHPTESMLNKMPNKDTRAIFNFEDGSSLYFNDQIKFGWIKLVQSSKLKVQSEEILGKLGPEPLEKSFTWEVLKDNLMKRKKTPIKIVLMDQSVLAGVGNIYASEALFLAKVDPRRQVGSLSDEEFQRLHTGIRQTLEESIKHGGTTIKDYVNADGERGEFLAQATVYGREGQLCKSCPGKVIKITQAGRGTYFCPNCQK